MVWPVLLLLVLAGCPLGFEYVGGADAANNPFRKKSPEDGGEASAVDVGAVDAARPSIADTYLKLPRAERIMDTPCAQAGSLSFVPASQSFVMACRGRSGLFRTSLPLNSQSAEWALLAPVPGDPTSHALLPDDHYAVLHRNPDGVTIVDADRGGVKDEVAFSQLPDRLIGAIGFTPSEPTFGFVEGDHLFIATQNVEHQNEQPLDRTFHQGGKIRFYLRNNATITNSTAWFSFTSGRRPIAMAELGAFRLILNGNALAHLHESEAMLDRHDATRSAGDQPAPLPLGNIVADGLAVTEGGLVLIGEHSPDAKLLVISGASADRPSVERLPLEGVQRGIADLFAHRQISAVVDADVDRQVAGSRILYFNHETRQQIPQLTEISGVVGATARDGQYLYLAVAEDEGQRGGLWRVDLGAVAE